VLTPTGAIRIRVASLDDLIDSKTYVDRDKDREALPELHELRRRLEHDT
jgi:predicted nucleotide-binding protein (sugar kinase/HSP70/actin superfamily)